MPTLKKIDVGPIVGHTDAQHFRIFFRAGTNSLDDLGRCVGAARCRVVGGEWGEPVLNKLSPNFDLTGVFVFHGLVADTVYEYQVGWFLDDADFDELTIDASTIDWNATESQQVKTGAATPKPRSYVVGSCRYLLRLFNGHWFDDRGDKVFRSILRQIEGNPARPVDALMMMGDQVYADDLRGFGPDTRLDQFMERYRTAFSQEHIRKLMSRVPTYMILDDHEIEDNWPSRATASDRLTLYPNAIHAYQIYQCSHGPLFETTDEGRLSGVLSHFWYIFGDAVCDWFVMDTRTERVPEAGQMIGPVQMTALVRWLKDGSGRIKFIVSSVPMFPDVSSDSADKWGAFPGQRKEILDVVFGQRIPNVVLLSGDVHTSFSCTLQEKPNTGEVNDGFVMHSVVSSSFFWPYPHMSRGSFMFDQPLSNMGMRTLLPSLRSNDCYGDDNFTRLDASLNPPGLQVSVYGRKGEELETSLRLF